MSGGTFGEQLRAHRIVARLTQAELGERAGVSERAISDIERGLRRRVYPVTARALADALGLGTADRATFEAAAKPQPAVPAAARSRGVSDWRGLRRTPILGRDDALRELLEALNADGARLVTITGTGGAGKSRLAAEVCGRLETDVPGRVIWVPLAGLREPELLLPILATSLGVSGAGEALLTALARALDQHATLLVLDTFEHVLEAATTVGALLDRTTVVRVLVTSRAPLRVRGEREYPLGALSEIVAAALFTQRARSVRPALALQDPEAAALVAGICVRLAGLPLAIELAASRVRHMSLHQLSLELERPLRLLVDGERDLPERQQAMRSTITWSYELLSDDDRVVFRRLAPFAGGWTIDAAERVCDAEPVIAAVGRLCEHGLIQTDERKTLARWHLLDPIREYAAEQLGDAPEAGDVARRHAEFYADLAETVAPRLLSGEQAEARARLQEEVANLRAALGWATRLGRAADLALRIVGALWMFWRLEGAFEEGRSWVGRALALSDAADSPYRPGALWGAAWLAYQDDELATATAFGKELLDLSATTDVALDRRNALTILGHIAVAERRFDDALPMLEEALDLARASNAPWHVATSLLNLGTVLLRYGDQRRAEEILEEAVAAHAAAGDRHFVAHSLVELAYAFLVRGETDGATSRLARALRTFLDLKERWGAAEALAGFAVLAAVRGNYTIAAVLTGASDAAYAQIATRVLAPDAALAAPFLAHARTMLGEGTWQQEVDSGRSLSIEDATDLALRTLGQSGEQPLV